MNNHKSHLTAIARRALPVPTRWLLKAKMLVPPVLDFGCGKCHPINNQHFKCAGYDPHWLPDKSVLIPNHYNTIICNYVLCVLTQEQRAQVLRDIQNMLWEEGGRAFISVRNDKPDNGWGFNKRGTYQGRAENTPLLLFREVKGYRMYLMSKSIAL